MVLHCINDLQRPRNLTHGFGPGSEVRFEKLLGIFNLLQRAEKPSSCKFGIGSVSDVMALSTEKNPYLSSPYCLDFGLSVLLIIGRSKVQVLLGPPFFIKIIELAIARASDYSGEMGDTHNPKSVRVLTPKARIDLSMHPMLPIRLPFNIQRSQSNHIRETVLKIEKALSGVDQFVDAEIVITLTVAV